MKLVARAGWGARSPKETPSTNFNPTGGSVLHWEGVGVPDVLDHSKCDDEVRKIQSYHMDTRGWNDIAYNFLVCCHGYVYEGRGIGKRSAANHNDTDNYNSYAICYIGDGTPEITSEGSVGMRDAVNYVRSKGAGKNVRPHSALVATQCPGNKIRDLISKSFFNVASPPVGDGYKHTTIKRGSSGRDVFHLQSLLKKWGAPISATGGFGSNTHHWFVHFQKSHGLVADGVCGSLSWRALHRATSGV